MLLLAGCGEDGTTWLGAQVAAGGSGADAGSTNAGPNFFAHYEAEAPENTLTFPVEGVASECVAACPADGVTEGADCCSGGAYVHRILGRSPCDPPTSTSSYDNCQNTGGGLSFNAVTVPSDGNYDLTWWYHCGAGSDGKANVYGDTACGGLDYNTGVGSGCRPHLIDVNGVPMSGTVAGESARYYQFPCYTTNWSVIHGATTSLPLKAGPNVVYIHAPGATTLDAADIDALDVRPTVQGGAPAALWPKLVAPVVSGY